MLNEVIEFCSFMLMCYGISAVLGFAIFYLPEIPYALSSLFWRIADLFQKPTPPQPPDDTPYFRDAINPDATIENNELSHTATIYSLPLRTDCPA